LTALVFDLIKKKKKNNGMRGKRKRKDKHLKTPKTGWRSVTRKSVPRGGGAAPHQCITGGASEQC